MTKARDIASAIPAPSTVSSAELGYLDGVTSAIQTQLDAKTTKATLTTTGDIYYASAANTPARLAIGSTSNVLTVAGGIPSWAAPAGGGKVLQVVEGTYATEVANATSTYADTNLTASITPSAASSKILVMTSQVGGKNELDADSSLYLQLLRGATKISELTGIGYTNNTTRQFNEAGFVKLDSPNTTSSTTYKVQFKNGDNSSGAVVQFGGSTSVIVLMEIGA